MWIEAVVNPTSLGDWRMSWRMWTLTCPCTNGMSFSRSWGEGQVNIQDSKRLFSWTLVLILPCACWSCPDSTTFKELKSRPLEPRCHSTLCFALQNLPASSTFLMLWRCETRKFWNSVPTLWHLLQEATRLISTVPLGSVLSYPRAPNPCL